MFISGTVAPSPWSLLTLAPNSLHGSICLQHRSASFLDSGDTEELIIEWQCWRVVLYPTQLHVLQWDGTSCPTLSEQDPPSLPPDSSESELSLSYKNDLLFNATEVFLCAEALVLSLTCKKALIRKCNVSEMPCWRVNPHSPGWKCNLIVWSHFLQSLIHTIRAWLHFLSPLISGVTFSNVIW